MKASKPNPLTLLGLAALVWLFLWPALTAPENGSAPFKVLEMTFFYGALAFSWNLFALTGAVSLGHAAFFGLGAYGSALAGHYWHLPVAATLLIGGLLGTGYAVLWSIFFGKLRGARLALATLASVELPKGIIDNWSSFTYGSLGLVGIRGLPSFHIPGTSWGLDQGLKAHYYLLLLFACLVGFIHRYAIRSRWGWAIRSVREDETAAGALGVNVPRAQFQALVLSGFLTSLCGGLYAHLIGVIEPGLVFSLHISALPLVLSIFGGRYQWYGPFLGAVLLYPVDQMLFRSWLPTGHAALYGLVIVTTLLFFPRGVGAWLQQRTKSA